MIKDRYCIMTIDKTFIMGNVLSCSKLRIVFALILQTAVCVIIIIIAKPQLLIFQAIWVTNGMYQIQWPYNTGKSSHSPALQLVTIGAILSIMSKAPSRAIVR